MIIFYLVLKIYSKIHSCHKTYNKNFNDELKIILIKNIGLKNNKDSIRHKENPSITSINFGGLYNVRKIYHYLYDNSEVFMERKKNEFEKAIN